VLSFARSFPRNKFFFRERLTLLGYLLTFLYYRRASDRDGRLNINSFSRTVKESAAAHTASLHFRDALRKLACCLVLVAPLCCAILAGLMGAALAYYQGWSLETGVLVALEEVLLTDHDFSSSSAASHEDLLELDTTAAKAGLAVCSLWGVAFLGMLVGVVGGPLTHPILAQLNLLPNDGRTHTPGTNSKPRTRQHRPNIF